MMGHRDLLLFLLRSLARQQGSTSMPQTRLTQGIRTRQMRHRMLSHFLCHRCNAFRFDVYGAQTCQCPSFPPIVYMFDVHVLSFEVEIICNCKGFDLHESCLRTLSSVWHVVWFDLIGFEACLPSLCTASSGVISSFSC